MKRVKKLFNITETTIAIIQKIAKDQMLPESYALDNICLNYYRMLYKGQTIPNTITKQEHKTKKSELKELERQLLLVNETLKETYLSEKQITELKREQAQIIDKINKIK